MKLSYAAPACSKSPRKITKCPAGMQVNPFLTSHPACVVLHTVEHRQRHLCQRKGLIPASVIRAQPAGTCHRCRDVTAMLPPFNKYWRLRTSAKSSHIQNWMCLFVFFDAGRGSRGMSVSVFLMQPSSLHDYVRKQVSIHNNL